MGGKTCKLLRNLSAPEKPSYQTFEIIVQTLASHLSPEPPRVSFHNRNQPMDENITDYIAKLHKPSQFCALSVGRSDVQSNRLACGMHTQSTQKMLLSEKLTVVLHWKKRCLLQCQ